MMTFKNIGLLMVILCLTFLLIFTNSFHLVKFISVVLFFIGHILHFIILRGWHYFLEQYQINLTFQKIK